MSETTTPPTTHGFGHAKVILLGEHAVVYGKPAVAAGLPIGVRAYARRGTGRLRVPEWSVEARAGDGSPIGRAVAAILARLGASDIDVDAVADVPPRAGLGSSAALSVAVARAVGRLCDRGEPDVRAAVADAEGVFHGAPSGIDAAAAWSGGVGRFQKDLGWSATAVLQPMTLCVGLSGKPRDTAFQVAQVGRMLERTPAARRAIDALGEVSEAGIDALAKGDIDGLGRLLDLAHGLLAALRASSSELDAMVHAARAAGAIGAKLTGAGGGGAVIALAPAHEKDVLGRWREDGFSGFLAEIGLQK